MEKFIVEIFTEGDNDTPSSLRVLTDRTGATRLFDNMEQAAIVAQDMNKTARKGVKYTAAPEQEPLGAGKGANLIPAGPGLKRLRDNPNSEKLRVQVVNEQAQASLEAKAESAAVETVLLSSKPINPRTGKKVNTVNTATAATAEVVAISTAKATRAAKAAPKAAPAPKAAAAPKAAPKAPAKAAAPAKAPKATPAPKAAAKETATPEAPKGKPGRRVDLDVTQKITWVGDGSKDKANPCREGGARWERYEFLRTKCDGQTVEFALKTLPSATLHNAKRLEIIKLHK